MVRSPIWRGRGGGSGRGVLAELATICLLFDLGQLQFDRPVLQVWLGRFPWRREGLPNPVFWPGEFHGLYGP